MNNLFVYGTLRKGKYNNYLLDGQSYVGEGKTLEKYELVIDVLPYLYKEPIDNIDGDIYIVDNEKLEQLDVFEGCPNFYYREKIHVKYNNEVIECFCYFHNIQKGE